MFFEFPTVKEDLDRSVPSGNRLVQFDAVFFFHRNRIRPAHTVLGFRPVPNGKQPDTLDGPSVLGFTSPLEIALSYDDVKARLAEANVARDFLFLETVVTKFAIRPNVIRSIYVEGDKTCIEFSNVARRLTIPDPGIYECARAVAVPPRVEKAPRQS